MNASIVGNGVQTEVRDTTARSIEFINGAIVIHGKPGSLTYIWGKGRLDVEITPNGINPWEVK